MMPPQPTVINFLEICIHMWLELSGVWSFPGNLENSIYNLKLPHAGVSSWQDHCDSEKVSLPWNQKGLKIWKWN